MPVPDSFMELDKHIRDAYVAGDKDALLAIAGVLALYADETGLRAGILRAEAVRGVVS
jgi:hypothetical protein